MPHREQLRIGEWRVDPVAGEISRGGEAVRLEARTMRLLLDLADHAGEVVSIDDLLDRVWAGVIVTPDSVYQAVASLRRLLGDDPKRPRYIATAPRLGYRMVARVEPWTEGAEPSPPRRSWRLPAAALAGAALVAGGFAVVGLRGPAAPTTVGVQPFLDMTPAMNGEVITDDLTERIADRLSQDPKLKTPSARASFSLKRKHLSPVLAARALGVAYVVDGSVHGEEPHYKVTVRLTRADSGFLVWSRAYDRDAAGLMTLQDAVAADVEAALKAAPRFRN